MAKTPDHGDDLRVHDAFRRTGGLPNRLGIEEEAPVLAEAIA